LNDNGNGDNNFVVTITIVSLCSLISATQKKEREKNKQKGTMRKNLQSKAIRKKKGGFSSISENKRKSLVGSWVAVSLRRLLVNLLFRFLDF
jgi:hypothetical protein